MLKVFMGTNESGVAYWRGKLPGMKMNEKGLADVYLYSVYDSRPEEVETKLKEADVVYTPSPCGVEAVTEFIKYYQLNKATVADYDDNLFDCHPFNPGYSTLGLNEVQIDAPEGNGGFRKEWLWKDERHGFSLKDNRLRFRSHIDVLKISSLLTTTTPYLQKILAEHVERPLDEFHICPNSIDFNLYKPFDKQVRNHKKLRIGWTASDSHVLEARFVLKLLTELYTRRDDFQFVIMGNIDKFRQAAAKFPVEWHAFCDIGIYPLKLASLELDIGICPLEDQSFNHSKSALKWSEYGAMRIPAVCTDLPPYQVIWNGADGLLASGIKQFADKIELLMDDSKLRHEMADKSWERNYQDFNLDKNVHLWIATFERALLRNDRQLMYKGSVIPKEIMT